MMPLVTFIIALILSLIFIPFVRHISIRMDRVAKPREDRWNKKAIATLGGIGIFAAFLASLFFTLFLDHGLVDLRWGMLAGSCIVFILGLYDDLKRISPQTKLVGQILAAAVVISFGYTTNFFTPRIANNLVAQMPNILLTFAWLVGITNAINLLDNMDGLAGGIVLITAGILSYFFWQAGNSSLLLVSLALAGSVLGFLVFNFPPASIFMGDSGSLFLGFTLAVLAIARQPQASNVFAIMGVPTLLFLLPILDTSLVTFTRILRGQSPTQGGRDHTSHRLIAFGLSERQAVLVLYGVALISGLMAAGLESLQYWYSLAIMPILVLSLALATAYLGGLKVVTPTSTNRGKAITRIILELTFRRRLLEVILDFFLIGIAYYLAFLIDYGFVLDANGLEQYLRSLPVVVAGAFLSFFTFGVYRGVWRYVSVDDLVRYFKAVLGSVFLAAIAVYYLFPVDGFSVARFILFAIFLFLGMAASRSSFKILDQFSGLQTKAEFERVLIYGAGDEGEMALRWILMNPHLDYRPVGFVDNDPFLTGRQIHGVEILGGLSQLESILENSNIDGLIITSDALNDGALANNVLAACRSRGCWVRSLRLEFELVE
jgi:UDP-GlcNAc:undecaprenyl-phosphate/decaprenyl-phosphate GlcNAc-1-phosphate transferase